MVGRTPLDIAHELKDDIFPTGCPTVLQAAFAGASFGGKLRRDGHAGKLVLQTDGEIFLGLVQLQRKLPPSQDRPIEERFHF
jgi:hypothetical protein